MIWRPEGEVRTVLQISHGVVEYALRYEPFAAFLTEHGFAVAANDHIGHGQSLAEGAPRLYFGPKGSWQTVVDDLYTLRCHCGKEFPGVPYALLGHSMGSFLARTYLIRYPGTVQAAVIMGTGQQSAAMTAGGRLVAARETRRLGGDDKVSKLAEGLAFGSYNKLFAPNRTSCDWLSLDTENVDRYLADPLCGGYATLGLFREMLSGLDFIRDPKNLAKMNANTPVFFVAASRASPPASSRAAPIGAPWAMPTWATTWAALPDGRTGTWPPATTGAPSRAARTWAASWARWSRISPCSSPPTAWTSSSRS